MYMRFTSLLFLAATAAAGPLAASTCSVKPSQPSSTALPTVYLAGDSTMAELGGSDGIEGWGHYLQYSLTIPVINLAVAGRSARSFSDQGRFQDIAQRVQPGDYVVIEFGHNDGGTLGASDKDRPDCPGDRFEVCTSTYGGQGVLVHTYHAYLLYAAGAMLRAGAAEVLISSMTPTNPYEGGSNFSYVPSEFVEYARGVAETLGEGQAAFVDHGRYEAELFHEMGAAEVDALFPNDHTHTSPEGADLAAAAFVKGLLCGSGSKLAGFVKNETACVVGSCLDG